MKYYTQHKLLVAGRVSERTAKILLSHLSESFLNIYTLYKIQSVSGHLAHQLISTLYIQNNHRIVSLVMLMHATLMHLQE